MNTNQDLGAYPYVQVIILFAGIGSLVGGLIAQLFLLFFSGMPISLRLGINPYCTLVCWASFRLW